MARHGWDRLPRINFAQPFKSNHSFIKLNILLMQTTLLFLNLGGQEIFLILIVVLLLFGGQKIPELMRGLGKGIAEFNKAKNSVEDEIRQGIRDAEQTKKPD
mgnify:CR=1 FL=1